MQRRLWTDFSPLWDLSVPSWEEAAAEAEEEEEEAEEGGEEGAQEAPPPPALADAEGAGEEEEGWGEEGEELLRGEGGVVLEAVSAGARRLLLRPPPFFPPRPAPGEGGDGGERREEESSAWSLVWGPEGALSLLEAAARLAPRSPAVARSFAALAHTVWGDAGEAARGLCAAVRVAPADPEGATALATANFLWHQRPRSPAAASLVKEGLVRGIRAGGKEGVHTPELLAKLAQVLVTPPDQEWAAAEALVECAHSLREHDPEIAALLRTVRLHPDSMSYALARLDDVEEDEEENDDNEASNAADPEEDTTLWENEQYRIKRILTPKKRTKQQEKRYREMMKYLEEVEETWNLELKSFLDQGNVDGGHDAGPSVENQGASWGEARKVPAKRRGASDEEYWHRFCPVRREEERSRVRQKQKDAINQYNYDYPWVPEEERGFLDNQTLVVRRFNGEGEVPPVFLDSEIRSTMSQLDVERIRLTGRPVQVVDHEETELAKQLSKLNGEVRYVDTAQGFRLTEDEFNFKVPWEMDAEVKEVWDQIPLVADIAEQLQQQNESVTWEAVAEEIRKQLPEDLAEDLPLNRTLRESLFEPATPVPGNFVLQPREILEPHGCLDDLYKWKEKDEKVGKIWKEKLESMERAGDFDEMNEEESADEDSAEVNLPETESDESAGVMQSGESNGE